MNCLMDETFDYECVQAAGCGISFHSSKERNKSKGYDLLVNEIIIANAEVQ